MNFIILLSEAAQGADTVLAGGGEQLIFLVGMMLLMGGMIFFSSRSNRKKEKALKELIENMTVGDSVITAGGIVGTVANIKDDEVTISTSVAHTMLTFKKTSISTVKKRETN